MWYLVILIGINGNPIPQGATSIPMPSHEYCLDQAKIVKHDQPMTTYTAYCVAGANPQNPTAVVSDK